MITTRSLTRPIQPLIETPAGVLVEVFDDHRALFAELTATLSAVHPNVLLRVVRQNRLRAAADTLQSANAARLVDGRRASRVHGQPAPLSIGRSRCFSRAPLLQAECHAARLASLRSDRRPS